MKHTITVGFAVLAATLTATSGVASANLNVPDAACAGFVFTMPAGEEGTVVRTFLDGAQVRRDVIARQFDPLEFTITSPDQTVSHVWAITIDSVWNADQTWSESVPACVTPPTTTPTTAPPSTVPPAPTTTAVVATTTPPVVASTIVTTPRQPTTTVPASIPPVAGELPATGPAAFAGLLAFIAAFFTGLGAMLLTINRGRSS